MLDQFKPLHAIFFLSGCTLILIETLTFLPGRLIDDSARSRSLDKAWGLLTLLAGGLLTAYQVPGRKPPSA